MLRDLLDALRCPHPHEESWLVAMVFEAEGPNLLTADLACPVCGAAYTIANGIACFGEPLEPRAAGPTDPLRLAALLGVTEGYLPLLLTGHYTSAGEALTHVVPVPQVWLNPVAGLPTDGPLVSPLVVPDRLPLGVATLAAAAVDGVHGTPDMLASIIRAVQPGGRIVAPLAIPVPDGLKELARDDQEWVAEVTARASGLVELRRRAPDQVG